jgi:AraC-like DNA-binding protein
MREIYSVFNSNGAYETGAHEHDEFMFMVPEHGLLRFRDEESGRSTSVIDRQFVLVPPQWSHSSSSMTTSQGHVAFYVDPDYMGYALRDLSGDANRLLRVPTLGIWHASPPLHHLLLAKKAFSQPDHYVDRRRQITQTDHLLLLECLAISLSQPSLQRSLTERHGAALVRDIQRYLDGNLEQSPGLDDIAEAFHVSRRHLTRLFAQHTGESVLAYVQRIRMERVKNLLQHTLMSVLEIANSVGYESPSHLAHVFRRVLGCSPDEFRRNANR